MRKSQYLLASCTAALLSACSTLPMRPSPAAQSAAVTSDVVAPNSAACALWPHEQSDVRPDPSFRYGCLANGMRYILRHNTTPPGEAVVRLHIDTGSLMEAEDQLGVAHFVEHMIFNGTRNVPEGEFVQKLERLGLAFGADTNASTNLDETIYQLNLPDVREEVVDTALLLMREAASEALMEPAAIDRERGVVLSEERTRDGPEMRMGRSQLDFLYPGQLVRRRLPIGTREIIQTVPAQRLVDFYNGYYRPENATLIVVGDVNIEEIEQKIRERFGDWRGRGLAGARPDLGSVAERGLDVQVFSEPAVRPLMTLVWGRPPELDSDNRAKRMERLRRRLVLEVLNRRLMRIARGENPPFLGASVSTGTPWKAMTQTGLTASFQPGGWRRALEVLEQEQRRIVQHGVTQAELEREITVMREDLRDAVTGAPTRSSGELAGSLLSAVNRGEVVTTPEDHLALFEESVRNLTTAQATDVARSLFRGSGPLLFVSDPVPVKGGKEEIARALERSRQVAVSPTPALAAKAWSYTNFGTAGRVVERREHADLAATFVRFANGVRLTVRPSRLEQGFIRVAAHVGDGQLDLPVDRTAPTWAAQQALVGGGLGRLTVDELNDALVGKQFITGFSIASDKFSLLGATRPQDLQTQLQVLAAYLVDPGWRTLGLERARPAMIDEMRQSRATPDGVLSLNLGRLITSGDPRFGQQSVEEIQRVTMADVRAMLRPLFTDPIEVVIAGDTTVEEAIRLTSETFGALPPRSEGAVAPGADKVRFPTAVAKPVTLTHAGRADQAMAVVAWPTTDFPSDPQKAQAVRVLQAVLRLRLIDEIRERQAVTYSPQVSGDQTWAFPGFGFLVAAIAAEPPRLSKFFEDAQQIVRTLREAPVSPDELSRAVGPLIEGLQRQREGNSYWATSLAAAQKDPRRLAAIRDAITGLQRVGAEDVQRVAREYLLDEKAFKIWVLPETSGAAPSQKGGKSR